MRLYVWHGGLIYVKKVTEKVSKNVLKTCRNVPDVTLKFSLMNLVFANARRRVIMNTAVDQQLHSAGWSSLVARRAHNPEVVGSNPAPATRNTRSEDISSDLFSQFGAKSERYKPFWGENGARL